MLAASAGSATAGAQSVDEPQAKRPRPTQDSASAPLWRSLERRMSQAGPANGAYVLDATANRVLYLRHQATPRSLASNTKLFTTAAALDLFGPDREQIAGVGWLPIATLIRKINFDSHNLLADRLSKGLGARFGAGGTTRAGAAVVRRFTRRVGSRVNALDGSGLNYANSATPRAVGRLLAAMLDHPDYPSFLGSLPIAGRQGTLAKRMRGTAAQDHCRAKTGTLERISTLSGYCKTRSGHRLLFSFLMNRVDVYAARQVQDSMTALLARR